MSTDVASLFLFNPFLENLDKFEEFKLQRYDTFNVQIYHTDCDFNSVQTCFYSLVTPSICRTLSKTQ